MRSHWGWLLTFSVSWFSLWEVDLQGSEPQGSDVQEVKCAAQKQQREGGMVLHVSVDEEVKRGVFAGFLLLTLIKWHGPHHRCAGHQQARVLFGCSTEFCITHTRAQMMKCWLLQKHTHRVPGLQYKALGQQGCCGYFPCPSLPSPGSGPWMDTSAQHITVVPSKLLKEEESLKATWEAVSWAYILSVVHQIKQTLKKKKKHSKKHLSENRIVLQGYLRFTKITATRPVLPFTPRLSWLGQPVGS